MRNRERRKIFDALRRIEMDLGPTREMSERRIDVPEEYNNEPKGGFGIVRDGRPGVRGPSIRGFEYETARKAAAQMAREHPSEMFLIVQVVEEVSIAVESKRVDDKEAK